MNTIPNNTKSYVFVYSSVACIEKFNVTAFFFSLFFLFRFYFLLNETIRTLNPKIRVIILEQVFFLRFRIINLQRFAELFFSPQIMMMNSLHYYYAHINKCDEVEPQFSSPIFFIFLLYLWTFS